MTLVWDGPAQNCVRCVLFGYCSWPILPHPWPILPSIVQYKPGIWPGKKLLNQIERYSVCCITGMCITSLCLCFCIGVNLELCLYLCLFLCINHPGARCGHLLILFINPPGVTFSHLQYIADMRLYIFVSASIEASIKHIEHSNSILNVFSTTHTWLAKYARKAYIYNWKNDTQEETYKGNTWRTSIKHTRHTHTHTHTHSSMHCAHREAAWRPPARPPRPT